MKSLAWALLTLGLLLVAPDAVHAQAGAQRSIQLERNFPNPFNRSTTIPFALPQELWAGGQRPRVSLKVYNALAQLIAVPILLGSNRVLDEVELDWNSTGQYLAFWNGEMFGANRFAPPGVYVYRLEVNGRPVGSRRMLLVQ